ncbi:Transposase [Popillia japonica]|uniref:Transposase n=1 Tax=Popillia japonica TaxID=7064 RepID=A0AAW1JZZ5_POPJA
MVKKIGRRVRQARGVSRATTRHEDDNIVNYVRETLFTTSQRILKAVGVNCSVRTIRKRLHEVGIHARVPTKKPLLTNAHTAARMRFCQENIDRNWRAVIFTDEKVYIVTGFTFGGHKIPITSHNNM